MTTSHFRATRPLAAARRWPFPPLAALAATLLTMGLAACGGEPATTSAIVETTTAQPPTATTSGLAGAPTAPATGWPTHPNSVTVTLTPPAELTAVTTGHDVVGGQAFDRVVLTFTGGLPGYSAQYVQQIVSPGSGEPVAVSGAALFELVLRPANAHDDAGHRTLPAQIGVAGLSVIRQVVLAGDYEGYVHLGIGLSSASGYRLSTLTGPDRLVLDFATPPAS
jgi:hypothetical protein